MQTGCQLSVFKNHEPESRKSEDWLENHGSSRNKNCVGFNCSAVSGFMFLSFFLVNTWAGTILLKGLHVQINNLTPAVGALGKIANITRLVLKLQKLPMLKKPPLHLA